MEQTEKRKILSVLAPQSPAQKKYLALIIWLIIAYALGFSVLFYGMLKITLRLSELGPRAEGILALKTFPPIVVFLFVTVILAVILGWMLALNISNHIVGPILRINRYLKDIIDGKETEIKIREEDDPHIRELSELVNRAVKK